MGSTAKGLPYPEPEAPARDGAAAIQSLATAVDTALGKRLRLTGTTDSNGNLSLTHGLGVVPSCIQVTPEGTYVPTIYRPNVTAQVVPLVVFQLGGARLANTSVTVNVTVTP